jgi:hypothetical protein
MFRKLMLTAGLAASVAMATASPAFAGGWVATGPHGVIVGHRGHALGYWGWGHGPCCGGAVAAGAIAGLAVGTAVGIAAASRPVYAAPRVVYAAPPPVVYAPVPYYYVR